MIIEYFCIYLVVFLFSLIFYVIYLIFFFCGCVGMDFLDFDKKFLEMVVFFLMVVNVFFLFDGEILISFIDIIMLYFCNGIV